MLRYFELKEKPREFLAATGITDEEFQALLPVFEYCYQLLLPPKPKPPENVKERARGGGRRARLADISDKLLFILVYQKTLPLQTVHGLQFGLSQGQVNHWIHRLLPVLEMSLEQMNMKPQYSGRRTVGDEGKRETSKSYNDKNEIIIENVADEIKPDS